MDNPSQNQSDQSGTTSPSPLGDQPTSQPVPQSIAETPPSTQPETPSNTTPPSTPPSNPSQAPTTQPTTPTTSQQQTPLTSSYVNPHGSHGGGLKTPLMLALLTILFVGLVGAGAFVLSQNQSQKVANVPSYTPPPQPKAQPTKPPASLTITSPADQAAVTTNTVIVSGKTSPQTHVVVYSDTDQVAADSDAAGAFQAPLILTPGFNTITITSYPETGDPQTQIITVIYDDSAIKK